MDSFNLNLSITLLLLLLLVLTIGGLLLVKYMVEPKYDARKTAMSNRSACKKANRAILIRNWTDYFWSDSMRAAWIMLFLTFFIALGFALANIWSLIFSFILVLITIGFIIFARKSYKNFPAKAAERLKKFEEEVNAAIEKEISFEGDNIQSFSDKDEEFDTKPKVFSFPAIEKKITFPPLASKKTIVSERKLDFLILSREYFSTCQGAATFNLLHPKQANEKKQCAETKGLGGECNEYYYSQMQNVEYDGKEECIRIIYYGDIPDAVFKCKKAAPNRKPAMKALKEKLRLTERQRLRKIDEHEKFEKIKGRRTPLSENKEENSNKEEE